MATTMQASGTANAAKPKTLIEAITEAMYEEMEADERVFCIGEDIGFYGGVFKATVGLLASRSAWKVKQDVGNLTNSASVGETSFGTTVQGDPWAIFVNNISGIYYLP